MNLELRAANRWCVVNDRIKPDFDSIRTDLFRRNTAGTEFSMIGMGLPSQDPTIVEAYRDGEDLLIVCLLYDYCRRAGQEPRFAETLEIVVDPLHDHVGWVQFIINEDGSYIQFTHLPYTAAHSTAFPAVKLKSVEVKPEYLSGEYGSWFCRWVVARFDMASLLRNRQVCGLNIGRTRPFLQENSSWNHSLGNSFQDATAFGHLYRTGPALELANVSAELNGSRLHLAGETKGRARSFEIEVADPLDRRYRKKISVRNGRWQGTVPLKNLTRGRYRVYPRLADQAVEPACFHFDRLPSRRDAAPFCVSLTNDVPMSIISNYYTPSRLNQEMAVLKNWGFGRVHWIEYGDWPSFWKFKGTKAMRYWGDNYRQSVAHCGDLLKCAARQARANGIELIADLKVFDLGMSCSLDGLNAEFVDGGDPKSMATDLEQCAFPVIPEIAAHPADTWHANPEWRRTESSPVTSLRLYSQKSIPRLHARDIKLWVSDNNHGYRPYRGKFQLRQGKVRRPHYRWTPAGKVQEPGSETNWFVELDGLNLKELYLSIEIARPEARFVNRPFMLVEAEHSESEVGLDRRASRDGVTRPVPLTVAQGGSRAIGFIFGIWPGWANQTEPVLEQRTWTGQQLGMVFRESPNIPSILEPASSRSREIWLERIRRIMVAGADGVSLRTLGHHNIYNSYLQYAFGPSVRAEFQSRFGRAPQTTAEDYERVRRIRGEFFTQFLRDARRLTSRYGKKIGFQFESGMEVPPQFDTRMQIHWDYETWLNEGLFDEISLKWFTHDNPFIHERLLPLARQHDIPVHVISRHVDGLENRGMESAAAYVTNARKAGFAGLNFYEIFWMIEMNPLGIPTPKGFTDTAMKHAMRELAAL